MRQQIDDDRFRALMATLAEAYGKKLSPETVAIYWDALKPLAIEQVEAAAKSAIRHFEFWPKPAQLYKRAEEQTAAAPRPVIRPADAPYSWGTQLVNTMYLTWQYQARCVREVKGDLAIVQRRRECLRLAEFWDQLKAEDMKPELGECISQFASAMKRADETQAA